MKAVLALVLATSFLLPPYITHAQEEPMPFIPGPGEASNDGEMPLPSCFDYYRFGSVPVVLGSEMVEIIQGGEMTFTGTVINENDYPVSDVAVYVKILHMRSSGEKDSFGPDVIDWFLVQDDLTLKAGEERALSFSWKVPEDALLGDYQAAAFVSSHDRFNMAGLSFTKDIIGGSHRFRVEGEDRGATVFDVTGSTIGGFEHHGAAFAPRLDFPEGGLPLTATVTNTSGFPFTGTVVWKLYAWDSLNKDNLIETRKEDVEIPQGTSLTLTYVVEDPSQTVYYLVGELTPAEPEATKSFMELRFITDALTIPRLNFVGATAYPVKEGTPIVACAHSTGLTEADNVRVDVEAYATDPLERLLDGGPFASASYEGVMPGPISAVVADAKKERGSFAVSAKLYQDDKLIDSVTVDYACGELGGECKNNWLPIVLGIIILIVLAVLLGVLLRKKRPQAPVTGNPV